MQACQVAHAALRFALAMPEVTRAWQRESETIAVLAVPDELALGRLRADAAGAGLDVVAFHEPDLGGALTALALEPAARPLVRRLPTALPRTITSCPGEEVTP